MSGGNIHEGFTHYAPEKQASEKSLGIVFAIVCALVAGIQWYHSNVHAAFVWGAAACLFLLAAYVWPVVLSPLNRFWMKLGGLLFALTNPLIMGIIFFGTVMPTGMVMRFFGKDLLKQKLDKNAASYWVKRAMSAGDMRNQF